MKSVNQIKLNLEIKYVNESNNYVNEIKSKNQICKLN